MTVKVQVPTKTFLGNGTASPLNFDKRFLDNADLVVTHIAASGTRTVLIEASDYTVSGAGEQNGGQITPLAPISVGDKWEIARNTPLMQPTDYADGDDFPGESHELALDRQMMIMQEQAAETEDIKSRAFLVPDGETAAELPALADRISKPAFWNSTGKLVATSLAALAALMAPSLLTVLPSTFKGDPGSPGEGYSTRAGLALALSTASNFDDFYLTEGGRSGKFIFSTADLSTKVADDPGQGWYIAPASDPTGASGAAVRDASVVRPEFWGVVDDPTYALDQTNELQDWLDFCELCNRSPVVPFPIRARHTVLLQINPMTSAPLASPYVDMRNLSLRPDGCSGIEFGDVAVPMQSAKIYAPHVYKTGAAWSTGAYDAHSTEDFGVKSINPYFAEMHLGIINSFTAGHIIHSENYGAAYSSFHGGHIFDCRFNEILRSKRGSVVPGGEFPNENNFYSGRCGNSSAANSLGDSFGTVLTWDNVNSYRGHNSNRWWGRCYEMAPSVSATYRSVVLFDGCGSRNYLNQIRSESGKGPIGVAIGGQAAGIAPNTASFNSIDLGYFGGAGTQVAAWLNTGGAMGNRIRTRGAQDSVQWNSGPLRDVLKSGGAAAAAFIKGPLATMRSGGATAYRTTSFNGVRTNTDYLQGLLGGGSFPIFQEFDATNIKDFMFMYNFLAGFGGRVFAQGLDAAGNILSGTTVDVFGGNDLYVKLESSTYSGNFGGMYSVTSDGISGLHLTVRDEVKRIRLGITGGTKGFAISDFTVIGFPTYNLAGGTLIYARSIAPLNPLPDDGHQAIATTNPTTAGEHGYYALGEAIQLTGAGPLRVTTAGYLAKAWTISTLYEVLGEVVINDTGKAYKLITAGTSAGSGGPTGTAADITDGTAHWKYIGVKAVAA